MRVVNDGSSLITDKNILARQDLLLRGYVSKVLEFVPPFSIPFYQLFPLLTTVFG